MSGPRRREFVGPTISRVTRHGGRGTPYLSRWAFFSILRASAEVDQHLHHWPACEGFLHALLEILERDAAAHERTDGDGARRRQADGLLPVGSRVEAAAVHGELTGKHRIEVH